MSKSTNILTTLKQQLNTLVQKSMSISTQINKISLGNNSKKYFKKTQTKKIQIKKSELKCNVIYIVLRTQESCKWYFVRDYSRHMTIDRSLFTNIGEHREGTVTFRDGSKANVIGKGTINLEGFPTLENVLFIDGLTADLISISQPCDDTLDVKFTKNKCCL